MLEPISAATLAGTAAAKKAGETFAERLLSTAGAAKRAVVDRAVVALRIGFEEYLASSYVRCRYFKTILNPYEPADLQETYIPLKLHDPRNNKLINDSEVFSRYKSGQYIVVTGLAGSGKSMLMRYLTLTSFESLESGTPLFVELRRINDYPSKDLLSFILKECGQSGRGVSDNQFRLALQSGLFNFILDGFDELEYEHRDNISQQIINLERDFPGLRVIVSSRPDQDRFRAWSSYTVYRVADFTRSQAVDLVNKTKYNEGVKTRFLKAMRETLLDSHATFLASPLLTTIMLLTFEEYAEIPTRMHAFYSRAFDTLFQKHDADKDQYVRKIKTGLYKDDFKLVLSTFCAISYQEERFSFSRDAAVKTAAASLEYAKQVVSGMEGVKAEGFISDLIDAVCMLQPDGLDLAFVHRSFQEYFSAAFIEKANGPQLSLLLDKSSYRFNDGVIGMALDMAREKIETSWIVPKIDYYHKKYKVSSGRRHLGKLLSELFSQIRVSTDNGRVQFTFNDLNSKELGPIESICIIYPEQLGAGFFIKSIQHLTVKAASSALFFKEFYKRAGYAEWEKLLTEPSGENVIKIDISDKDDWWLKALGFDQMFDDLVDKLNGLREEITTRETNRQEIMRAFIA